MLNLNKRGTYLEKLHENNCFLKYIDIPDQLKLNSNKI